MGESLVSLGQGYKQKKPGRLGPGFLIFMHSPEKVANDVNHMPVSHIDQKDIVIIPHPTVAAISGGQAILPRGVDPKARTKKGRA
jgi:hypothetical protein